MTYRVQQLRALEILDSRGRPTLQVTVALGDGSVGTAGVPSGASTGAGEAVELRDGDPARYAGRGVSRAVRNVTGELATALVGRSWEDLGALDRAMIDLDGSPDKSRLGANAIVGVSMAAARAMAAADRLPLYRWLPAGDVEARLPVPHFNVLNGGAHAPNRLEPQEFMIAPLGAGSFAEALRAGAEIYEALRKLLADRGLSTGLGDEGGFAPELSTPEEVLDLIVTAIGAAGHSAGPDGVAVALDPAASQFRVADGRYRWSPDELLSSDELVDHYAGLVERYPIWSIEDGLAEDDWAGWELLTARIGDKVRLVGDDIFVTNPKVIADAMTRRVGNSALIKLNQIGAVSETLEAMAVCRSGGYGQMVSHRSGETNDAWIADLAVATGCGLIKSGAPARGERVAKYNRLLEIAAELPDAPYGPPATGA